MTISAGSRLGPYEVLAPLGAGGMGEVWKGRDTRLDREVAIKVLPPGFAHSEQFRARFDREAKTISSLNHPNICTLFDVGHEEDVHFLVMELIDGESLADRLAKGALPLDLVIRHGAQIAEALHAAHKQGIVHRDLKPGNVMLTKSGAKLLDFGLARAVTEAPLQGLTEMPTQARPLTAEGTILGTFQYMAPEQLEGIEADARTDIFALGALLYEMATGQRAFRGTSKTSLIAAIVSQQPVPISSVTQMTPPALDHVVSRCLEKDPEDRWQSAHDVASELRWISEAGSQAGVAAPVSVRRKTRERLAWGLAAAAVVSTIAFGALWSGLRKAPEKRVVRSAILFPEGVRPDFSIGGLAISPDGTQVVFVAISAKSGSQIWHRSLDQREAQAIAGTGNGVAPFWSPDSRSIGFFADGKLKRIDVAGGLAQTLADAPDPRGGAWSEDGTIVYAPVNPGPLHRVSLSGGTSAQVTEVDKASGETNHRYPVFLPGGRKLLFLAQTGDAQSGDDRSAIYLLDLDTNKKTKLIEANSAPLWAPPGLILFWKEGFLAARRFDPDKGQVMGQAFPVAEGVEYTPWETPMASISNDGTLVYQPSLAVGLVRLAWLDREGKEMDSIAASENRTAIEDIRLSPDGLRLLFAGNAPNAGASDLWIRDLERGTETRFTFDPASEFGCAWSPHGKTVYFTSDRASAEGIFSMPTTGEGDVREIAQGLTGYDVFPDGGSLLVGKRYDKGAYQVWRYSLSEGDVKPITHGTAAADWPRLSPDGNWVAYESSESKQQEIYVTRVDGTGKWQISTGGGYFPVWSHDGREVFYIGAQLASIWTVEVDTRDGFRFSSARKLFDLQFRRGEFVPYDVSPDGKRFLVNTYGDEAFSTPLTLVQNWTAEVKGE
ncbi:MAG: protein kinase domain-containing protein [Thermoanaerobaculia bacterium]